MRSKYHIIAEEYQVSSGMVFDMTYKGIKYSLTLKPDIIKVFRVTRKELILETSFKTLEEFLTWYNELKATYKNRIKRSKLHYIDQKNGAFIYTDYHKATNCGMRASEGIITVPQTIIVPTGTEYSLGVFPDAITVLGNGTFHRFTNDKDYQEWYQLLVNFYGKVTRRGIKYYRYENNAFHRVSSSAPI